MANIRHYGNEIAVGEAGGTFLGKCCDRMTDDNDHDNDDDDGLMKMIMMRRQREPSYTNIASSTIQIHPKEGWFELFTHKVFFSTPSPSERNSPHIVRE